MTSKGESLRKIKHIENTLILTLSRHKRFSRYFIFNPNYKRLGLASDDLRSERGHYPEIDLFFYSEDLKQIGLIEYEAVYGQPVINLMKLLLYLRKCRGNIFQQEYYSKRFQAIPDFNTIYYFLFTNSWAMNYPYYSEMIQLALKEIVPIITEELEKHGIIFVSNPFTIDYKSTTFIDAEDEYIVSQMATEILAAINSV